MPHKNRRELLAQRKSDWMALHPCACGRPSEYLHPSPDIWSHRLEVREAALRLVVTLCGDCENAKLEAAREWATVRRKQREAARKRKSREVARTAAAKKREPMVIVSTHIDERLPRAPRNSRDRPLPLFENPVRCECGETFSRIVLKVRHQRTSCRLRLRSVV